MEKLFKPEKLITGCIDGVECILQEDMEQEREISSIIRNLYKRRKGLSKYLSILDGKVKSEREKNIMKNKIEEKDEIKNEIKKEINIIDDIIKKLPSVMKYFASRAHIKIE